ncbi:hypothetical protein BDR22DRAFT_822427 [Usnea florida]
MHHLPLLLLSLLTTSASTIVIPIEPILPGPIIERIYLPGWPTCPDQCVLAIRNPTVFPLSSTGGNEPQPVCFEEPAHKAPCSYYYCCGKPVTCGVEKEVCVTGEFDEGVWVPGPLRVVGPVPED